MLKLFLIASLAASCCIYAKESNDQWEPNDDIVKIYDAMYNNLARSAKDASNRQKRTFTIVLTGILRYMASGGNDSVTVDVDQPADVIASETRSQIDVSRSILDPAINMVKRACPPTASQKECSKALAAEKKKEMKKCSNFDEVFKFFQMTEKLFSDTDFQKLICASIAFSKKGKDDDAALKYLEQLKHCKKYKKAFSELIEWYKAYADGDYTCNLPPVECN